MACMHICPTQAIRVRRRVAAVLTDRCMDCGECVRVCPNAAILPRTSSFSDFSGFKYTIAIPSPVFYAQFGKDVRPAAILRALRDVGFDEACDVAGASEAVSIAIQEYLDTADAPRPHIAPFCPAIVRLVQIRYPNLLSHLIPIESPMVIAAREAKQRAVRTLGLRESEIGVIYITPCPAKMLAIKDPSRRRHAFVNGAIAINQIYPAVHRALARHAGANGDPDIKGLGLGWPALGGQVACLKAEDCLSIGGVGDAIRVFEEIENGKLKDIQYIEVHSCPTACVGGSLTVENSYIARGRVLTLVRKYGATPGRERAEIRELYRKNFFAPTGKIPPVHSSTLAEDVPHGLQKLNQKRQLLEQLPGTNCGACGAPTCGAFAEDVVKGDAGADDCVFLAMRNFDHLSESLLAKVRGHGARHGTGKDEVS
jgi:Fe-S-cluster-containing hydrogenase component 2